MEMSTQKIDGSMLEGGGQIIRFSSALSVLTSTKSSLFNIRKNRPKGGLKNQHLKGIKALGILSKR